MNGQIVVIVVDFVVVVVVDVKEVLRPILELYLNMNQFSFKKI